MFLKKVEIAVNDEYVKATVDGSIDYARTGSIGDGKILVIILEFKIGEEGCEAVGYRV